jgi:hypothetical protein
VAATAAVADREAFRSTISKYGFLGKGCPDEMDNAGPYIGNRH